MEKKDENGISHSKQKRQDRVKKQQSAKRNNVIGNIVWAVIGIALVAVVVAAIVLKVTASQKVVVASDDLGAELADNGFIKDVKASDYITLFDYKNIKIPVSEVTYTEEEMNAEIESVLDSHKQINTETDAEIADGDTVNIDFVGSIDGEEFDGGNSNGEGYDLTIGSHSFIDDFEQQLIGYKIGEVVNVNVDFPEDYGSEELAGKNADFVVTINGIYERPELTDEFVADSLAAYASTVDEYKAYLKKTAEEDKINTFLGDYVKNNTVVNKYPKKFLNKLKATTRYSDEQTYEYMNQMYMQYYGSGYSSFEEYMGMSDEEYMQDLENRAKDGCLLALADQAILESEGISFTPEEIKAYGIEEYGSEDAYNSAVEQYGMGYVASGMIPEKALEIIKGYAVVE